YRLEAKVIGESGEVGVECRSERLTGGCVAEDSDGRSNVNKSSRRGLPMRKGFKIFDTDTHVSASAEALEPYLSSRVRELVPDLDERKVPIKIGLAGEVRQEPYRHSYRLGRGGMEGGWGGPAPRILREDAPR